MNKRPHFETINVSSTDPVFTSHDTSDIAERIGLPILTRRCAVDARWANRSSDEDDAMFEHKSPSQNQDATFLHLCCDPGAKLDIGKESLGWGWSPQSWQNNVGSVIVVRKDRKPLLPLHMEALAKYCREEVISLFAHSNGSYHPEQPMKKGHVLSIICRPMFVIYWNKFLEQKNEYSTPSPYE
ncbi:zinc finger mynd-type protein [Pyrenophora tritici-repentis]|nr:zinc finger mynd-type protein [Pyrenophora tritici-repentis]